MKDKMNCIFCDTNTRIQRAKEHIIPQWALDEFDLRGTRIIPTHFSETGEVLSDRLHDMNGFLAGRICAECNNGWMSALERQNKDLIIELAQGRRDTLDLTDAEATGLARWAFKTALCLHSASNYRRIIPANHYHYVRINDESLPKGVFVVGKSKSSIDGFSWAQSTSWFIYQQFRELSNEDIKTVHSSAYKICIQLLNLLLLVAYNPLIRTRFMLCKYVHVPLFPLHGPVTWFEDQRELPNHPFKAMVAYHHMFSLAPQAE